MKKVLFVASVSRHINAFHVPYLRYFKERGYTVEVASNGDIEIPYCDKRHQINFERSPLKKANLGAYKELKKIIKNGEYDIIHCHTPVAGMLTRLAARKMRKKGTRVIYTAHGFHFFKGAPIKNWLIYFPVEWFCSFFTDTLITINQEDYAFAKKRMHAKQIEYVHGVGLDIEKFKNIEVDREKKRQELGIPKDCTAVLSVGELNDNKNHETILRAIAKLERKDIVYVICGKGNKEEHLKNLAKELGMENRLILAGYRTDVVEIYKCCDIFAFPSKREGLPVSVMEAMASGLPCVVSDIRGNRDLIQNGENGFLRKTMDVDGFSERINLLAADADLRERLDGKNKKLLNNYSLENVTTEVQKIYKTK